MDKRIIGRHIIVYTGSVNIDPVETKSNVRPSRSFLGT